MKRSMSCYRFLTLALATVGIFAMMTSLAGCQAKMKVDQTFTLPLDDQIAKIYIMPAQGRAQTITVQVTVKSGPNVDVYVLPADLVGENIEDTPKERKEWETKGFGSMKDAQGGTMTAKVTAKTEFKVLIIQTDGANGKSQVDVKIHN